MWNEVLSAPLKVLFQYLHRGTKKTTNNLSGYLVSGLRFESRISRILNRSANNLIIAFGLYNNNTYKFSNMKCHTILEKKVLTFLYILYCGTLYIYVSRVENKINTLSVSLVNCITTSKLTFNIWMPFYIAILSHSQNEIFKML